MKKLLLLINIISLSCIFAKEEDHTKRLNEDFKKIEIAIHRYKLNAGNFPTTEQGLKALVERPTEGPMPRAWKKQFERIPSDPWGREYQYKMKDNWFTLWSKGPDEDDPSDDIYQYDEESDDDTA